MRVVRWLGCTSGRLDQRGDYFGPGQIALHDADGHAEVGHDDTRLPSERLGRKPVVVEPAPQLHVQRKRLSAGASV